MDKIKRLKEQMQRHNDFTRVRLYKDILTFRYDHRQFNIYPADDDVYGIEELGVWFRKLTKSEMELQKIQQIIEE